MPFFTIVSGPKSEKKLRKKSKWFSKESLDNPTNHRRSISKESQSNISLFEDFSNTFDSIQRGNMDQILLGYCLPNETVTAVMMLYKNTKVMVRLTDRETDFFNIDAGVLQKDTLAPYFFFPLPRWHTSNINKSNKRKCFHIKRKQKNPWYPAETMTDADNTDDLALLTNTPAPPPKLNPNYIA